MRWATPAASVGNSSNRHSLAKTPQVRGAAFFGVLRLAGARLRFAAAVLVLAGLLVAMRELRKERREHTSAPDVNLGRVFPADAFPATRVGRIRAQEATPCETALCTPPSEIYAKISVMWRATPKSC